MNTPLQPQPPYPVNPQGYPQINRTAGPAKVLGILYAVLAVLSLFGFIAVVALAFIPGFANHDANDPMSAAAPKLLFGFVAVIIGISILLHAFTAYGLLALKSWGRMLAIVTGILSLISIPVGTILGIFTLYFFMRQGAEQEYIRLVMERNQYPGQSF